MNSLLPTGMVQEKAPVLLHRRIAPAHYFMRLRSSRIASRTRPGQFIHLLCAPSGDSALLRRPFSLLDVNEREDTIDFIYKVVGVGTKALTELPVGSTIDLLGPLGNPFEVPRGLRQAFLVGGGVGIPPLYLLAKELVRQHQASSIKCQVEAILGARTKGWVICAKMFRRLGVETHVATDDGTLGHKGSVVDLLRYHLDALTLDASQRRALDAVLYICGPTPMMSAAAKVALQMGLSAQVSLEERMGCAMGCCMGCVVEIASEPAMSHKRFQRVCTEGPVFRAEEIVWSE